MKLNLRKSIIFSGISIFLTILVLSYFFLLPALINIEKYKPEIKEALKENLSLPLELGKLDIDMTWNLGLKIKINRATLKKRDGSNFVSVGNSSGIEISLLPLLNKKIEIRKIIINNMTGNVTRLKDGSFDIAKIFIKKEKTKYKVEIKDTSVVLNNYRIDFSDKFISPAKEFVLSGETINISKFTPDKYIEIEAKGKISEIKKPEMIFNIFLSTDFPFNKKKLVKNILKIKGDIINFDLQEIKPYINIFSNHKFTTFIGTGNVNFDIDLNKEIPGRRKFFVDSKINNLNIIDAAKGSVLSNENKLKFITSGNFDDNDLYLDNFQVNAYKLNAAIRGKISNFANRKIRNVDLKIDINDTRVKKSAEIFPKLIKVPLDPFNKMLKYNVDGNVSGNIIAKGYYRRPELFGKVKYDDFSIIKKIKGTPNGYGSVEFLGPTLVINSKQYLDKNEFVKTTGTVIPFKGKKVKLSINTTQNIDFSRCLPVLFAVRDIFQFKLYPVTDMDIKGIGKVNLDIEGANQNAIINGYVEARNAKVKFKTLAGQAENVNGRVRFTGDKVYYDELSGSVDGIKVIPSGYSTLHAYSDIKLHMPNLDLKKGQKFVYGSSLLYKAQFALKDILDIKGFADTVISLKGTEEKLDSRGVLKFTDAYLKYRGYAEPFNNLKGQLRYINENIYFDNINGNVLGNNVTANGSINGLSKDLQLTITSKNIKLENAKKFVINSSVLYKTQEIIKDFTFVDGIASINLKLKGNVDKDPLDNLIFSNINATFQHKLIGFPIKISQGILDITNDSIQTQGIKANAANTDFIVKGKVSNLKANIKTKASLIPDLKLEVNKFDASNLKEIVKTPVIPQKIKKIIAKTSNFEGFADVIVNVKPSGFNAAFNFDNFALVYIPNNIPVVIKNGKAEITDKSISFYEINGQLANSDFFLKGFVKNYLSKPSFEILSSLKFNPEDTGKLEELFKQSTNAETELNSIIPISVNIKGNVNNWQVLSKMTLNKGVSLPYTKQMGLSDDKIRIITLDALGKKDRLDIKNLKLDLFRKDYNLNSDSPWEFNVLGEKENIIHVSGSIDKLSSGRPLFKEFKINTNNAKPLSSCILNQCVKTVINNGNEKFFSEGNIQADLTMNGYIFNPKIQGFISFSGLKIPDYKLSIANANINFDKDSINLDLQNLKIDDSAMNIKALLDYSLEFPLMVKDMEITSNYINVDRIARVLVANKDIVNTNTEDMKSPYFLIQDGHIDSKELILRDLITSGIKADLNFTPDWLLSVSDINMNVTGGTGTGNLYYNAKSTELSLNLTAKNMQANALASTLLSMPNEVYGTLNGEGQFYTKGRNAEEMISNSNGYANFKINDGHLIRLGSLEYLLRATNVLQCGIGGLNFNNIIDLVVPQNTGYFDHLDGKFDIKDGVLSTEEVTSAGQNLSLLISGNFDMLTNYADIKVLGKLSNKVSGLLGPLGSVSINQFIGYIPGFGFLPTTPEEKGLIDLIPGLSNLPVLGLDGKQKYRKFLVNINGNLYDQKSVKSFRWLN